jgi:hypothetical protein
MGENLHENIRENIHENIREKLYQIKENLKMRIFY